MKTKNEITIPEWITKNYYREEPASRYIDRSRNELKAYDEVLEFFKLLDFTIIYDDGEIVANKTFNGQLIEVYYSYSESNWRIYKRLKTYKDGKKSNVKIIRKMVEDLNDKTVQK